MDPAEDHEKCGPNRPTAESSCNNAAGWVQAGQAERTQGKSGLMKEDREELVRLRKELRIVQEERDILKKAAAYFAKQSR